MTKWFESWFDTEYYHLLYNNRDYTEAERFIRRITSFLLLQQGDAVADICCGKGRHSQVMAELGFRVWGMDLSSNSIAYAKKMGISGAEFDIHDIRESFPKEDFAAVFNLFTSFGYFETTSDDESALKNMAHAAKLGGFVVQDYLNAGSVIGNFPQQLTEKRDGCDFVIEKLVEGNKILKRIQVVDLLGNHIQQFQEEVRIYSVDELVRLHEQAGLTVQAIKGSYNLDEFDAAISPRMIVISKKL